MIGLSSNQAADRLRAEGRNEIPRSDHRSAFRIAVDVLREPMLLLTVAGGAIYLALGDLKEALLLLAFGLMSVVITVVQATRTERVLEALRQLAAARALVVRDGQPRQIPAWDVVRDDVLVVAEGDRVAADAVLIEARDLLADEALLTGESIPVRKSANATMTVPHGADPGGENQPFIYSGSLIVRGTGQARVVATGPHTEIGKIGHSLQNVQREPPHLRRQITRLLLFSALGGAIVSIAVILMQGFLRGTWLPAVLEGIAVQMALLPEEFPVVLTVFFAMGAWRISKVNVLTRDANAIEALGAMTVLCTDKTGTLTQNSMSVRNAWVRGGPALVVADETTDLTPDFRELGRCAALASLQRPHDPMETAFHAFAARFALHDATTTMELVKTYPLRPDLLAMSQVWRAGAGPLFVATKGAPEAVARLCHLSEADNADMLRSVSAMAEKGLRVLAIASAAHDGTALPDAQGGFAFRFLGLLGLADPLRPSVAAAVKACQSAGVRIVMITGDYAATALAIAGQSGLDATSATTGDQVRAMDDAQLGECVRRNNVFARITPDQKLRIVNALKSNGEIVAMTGDGVNDAPSLKAAHIGVAMGKRGTDVAREAASIVLMDDEFKSIVAGVELGRRIYDNLRKAMAFIFAVHVPIAGLSLLPLAISTPIILAPVHIAFLELIIDPVCSLVFEAEDAEKDVLHRPPRSPDGTLFPPVLTGWSILQGGLVFAVVAAVYGLGQSWRMDPEAVRGLTFLTLVLCILSLVLANRSFDASLSATLFRMNGAFLAIVAALVAMLIGLYAWPPASSLFGFGALSAIDVATAIAAGFLVLVMINASKRLLPLANRIGDHAAHRRHMHAAEPHPGSMTKSN